MRASLVRLLNDGPLTKWATDAETFKALVTARYVSKQTCCYKITKSGRALAVAFKAVQS